MAARKHKDIEADSPTSSAKRTKLETDNGSESALDYVWEWRESGSDGWTAYSSGEQERITKSFSKEKQLKLDSLFDNPAVLNFLSMTHTVQDSDEEFEFRCRCTDSATFDDLWQWRGDDGEWQDYSDEAKRKIESAQTLELYTAGLTLGKTAYEIDFSKQIQKNTKNKGERRIRKYDAEKDSAVAKPKWQWKDDTGKWKDFTEELNEEIEQEYAASKKRVDFKIGTNQYKIDFATKLQVNSATGISRQVKRIEPKLKTNPTETDDKSVNNSKKMATRSTRSKKSEPAPTSSSPPDEEPKPKSTEKSVKFTGKAIVDSSLASLKKAEVYSEGSDVYDIMLNQTNLKNNNNKFYAIQLIQSLSGSSKNFSVFTRWGRVGLSGQCSTQGCGSDLTLAKHRFETKFYDKTHNNWDERNMFQHVPGKYDMVDIDYGEDEDMDVDSEVKPKKESEIEAKEDDVASKLHSSLQSFIEFICDVKAFESIVKEMKYDTKKAPLGKLTKDQITAGFSALLKIEQLIKTGKLGNELIEACNTFYTRIPHSFGMSRPPVINNNGDVKKKIGLLEALGDIEIAVTLIKGSTKKDVHPIDQHYLGLHCELEPLSRISEEFKLVEKYTLQTHGPTHTQYKLLVVDIFKVDKEKHEDNYVDHGNNVLLWHGSRLTNWVGILSQGLRIAPPEAPSTGYMFGKGLYFADVSSKSANYCHATPSNNQGCLLLCEVSLGNTQDLLAADSNADNLPAGKHSVFAKGKMVPDPTSEIKLEDGCRVPLGKIVDTSVNNPTGYTLNYNEYVVYNVHQVKFRYLLRVKFNFK